MKNPKNIKNQTDIKDHKTSKTQKQIKQQTKQKYVKPSSIHHTSTHKKIYNANEFGINQLLIDHDALMVIKKLQKANYEAYIVGGGIRDLLLNKTPKDFDIVTNAQPEMIRKVFKHNSIIIGRRFKIVHINFNNINPDKFFNNRPIIEKNIIEVSTYRSIDTDDKFINKFGKLTNDNNYGTQDEDAMRRDFTINALYYDPINETIIDYHDGMIDIKNYTLKIIGNPKERYLEDPVRILRAIRLSSKLSLSIEDKTLNAITSAKHLLTNEHKWRLYEEMLKILLSGAALKCIELLKKFKIPKNVLPLLDTLFFKKIPDPLAISILNKTDLRLQENSDVSVVFILAGLLWGKIYKAWNQELKYSHGVKEALKNAIALQREYIINLCIPKYIYQSMKEVWLLQINFEYPSAKQVNYILHNSRFRQALHLFNTRSELSLIDHETFLWWDKFMIADDNMRSEMLKLLKNNDLEL